MAELSFAVYEAWSIGPSLHLHGETNDAKRTNENLLFNNTRDKRYVTQQTTQTRTELMMLKQDDGIFDTVNCNEQTTVIGGHSLTRGEYDVELVCTGLET